MRSFCRIKKLLFRGFSSTGPKTINAVLQFWSNCKAYMVKQDTVFRDADAEE